MRRIPLRFWLVSTVVLAINVAGWAWVHHAVTHALPDDARPARLIAALPSRNVDAAERLSLLFDAPVAAPEVLDRPLIAAPFVIDPLPKGHWIWSERSRLDFVLDQPLPAGQRFIVKPAADAEQQTGRILQVAGEISFATRALRLDDCRLESADRDHVTFELKFNQKVDPTDIIKHLTLSIPHPPLAPAGGEGPGVRGELPSASNSRTTATANRIAVEVVTKQPDSKLLLRCSRSTTNQLQIELAAELTGHAGRLALGERITRSLDLPPLPTAGTSVKPLAPLWLLRADAHPLWNESRMHVSLRFSTELKSMPDAAQLVRFDPPVPGAEVWIDRSRLSINGPFAHGLRYSATVNDSVSGSNGERLTGSQSISFETPDRDPAVRFPISKGILSPHGYLLLDVETVNVAGLELAAARVHANNLVQHLRGEYENATARKLNPQTLRIGEPGKNITKTTTLDLRQWLETPLGVYHLRAKAADHAWRSDDAVVTVTDLALTCKHERSGLLVWVTSLRTAQPVPNVKVSSQSFSNQTLSTAMTDSHGIARLSLDERHPDGKPWVIIAEQETDLAFLQLDHHPWVLDHVSQSGRDISTGYDVLIYPERGAYRPGDTIHLTGLIRDANGETPPAFPLSVTVIRPDGRQVANLTVTPDAAQQNFFHCDFPTRDDNQTGPYRFRVSLPGSNEILGQTHAQVEAFLPVRMEVTAKPTQPRFGPHDKPAVNIHARYLFGQPASDLPVTVITALRRIPFRSTKHTDFTFGDATSRSAATPRHSLVNLPDVTAKLDASGTVIAELPPLGNELPAVWNSSITATVTEPGGRSVSHTTTLLLDTADRHVGLRCERGPLVGVNEPVSIDWLARSGTDEAAAPGPIELTLEHITFDSVLQRVNGHTTWNTVEHAKSVWSRKLSAVETERASGTLTVTCPSAGVFRLRAKDITSGSVTVLELHAASHGGESSSFAMQRPEHLELVLDKNKHLPGETATVLVKSPFAGTLWLCLESNRVLDHRVIDIGAGSTSLNVEVPATLRGGAFVTATVVRKIDSGDSSWLPHRAMGMARLETDHTDHELPVRIAIPSQSRPGDKFTVRVETTPSSNSSRPTAVHCWAVDEGILLTTAYPTPHPFRHFLAHRKLGVISNDVFGDLLPDHKRALSIARIGGDRDDHDVDTLRRSPVPTKRRDAAVLWRGIASTDAAGHVAFDVTLPQFTGELRFMAVAGEGDRYGSTQQPLTVTQPLLVEAAAPRVAAPGDKFEVPVKLFNSTTDPIVVRLSVNLPPSPPGRGAGGEGELLTPDPKANPLDHSALPHPNPLPKGEGAISCHLNPEHATQTVLPGKPITVWLTATAARIGLGEIRITAEADSQGSQLVATADISIPVRPATPLHSVTRFVQVAAGQPLEIEPPAELLPDSIRTTLTVSGRPTVQLSSVVNHLIDYPYGCAEQTSSRLFALLAAKEMLSGDITNTSQPVAVAGLIDAGVSRLWSMQTRAGGLGYWPAASGSSPWATAYAAGALLEARRQGHVVDSRFVDELATFLRGSLSSTVSSDDFESRHGFHHEEIDDHTRARICRVLAGFGKPDEGWMSRLTERVAFLDMAGRADLAAAWLLVGRKDRSLAVLPDDTLGQSVPLRSTGRLGSQTYAEANLLGVLLDLDRGHPWIPTLVRRLDESRRDGRWQNTLENAAAVAALTRFQSAGTEASDFTGSIQFGPRMLAEFKHDRVTTTRVDDHSQPMSLTSNGRGQVYISVTSAGLRRDAAAESHDRRVRVRRRWLDRSGQAVDPARLRVGDLVVVEVTLDAPEVQAWKALENIAIVDALPGGFEVENPRLETSQKTEEDSTNAAALAADHVEFLDDRVVLFASASREVRTFRYPLRAVSAGQFAQPPIQASSMYDAGVASVHGGGRIEVQP